MCDCTSLADWINCNCFTIQFDSIPSACGVNILILTALDLFLFVGYDAVCWIDAQMSLLTHFGPCFVIHDTKKSRLHNV